MDTKIIHNTKTNTVEEIELTSAEQKIVDNARSTAAQIKATELAELQAQATEKAALLAKLGISEAEAKLLLS